jgi:Holliday junction DNA helicase RuvA
MYEYISGAIAELNPAYAIIESGGIGYHVNISLNTYTNLSATLKNNPSQPVKVFLHLIVREDAHLLFGFSAIKERDLFRQLISVSGIGANTARMILSSLSPAEIQKAISEGNVNVLKGIKGIGIKTAQRIIVDLKDKIGIEGILDEKFLQPNNTIKDEALSALVTLGFNKSAVEKMLDKLLAAKPGTTVEELIKQTLKNI